jgi:subtilisin family serine protease
MRVEAVIGTSTVINATCSVSEDIRDTNIWITPQLADYITIVPAEGTYGMNDKCSVRFIVSIPKESYERTISGNLHIRSGMQTVAQPLPIILMIGHASSMTIPGTIAMPSIDRIYDDGDVSFVIDEALVSFKEGVANEERMALAAKYEGVFLGGDADLNLYQIAFRSVIDPSSLDNIIAQLINEPIVDIATRSWITKARRTPDTGKDPVLNDVWNEQEPWGRNSALEYIMIPSAWTTTIGSKDIDVAVIDYGFDLEHEDLIDNITISGDGVSEAGSEHGTAVAGIIGAKGNNAVGISGGMWDLSLQVYGARIPLTESSSLTCQLLSRAEAAIDNGARIINLSAGIDVGSEWLSWMIDSNNFLWRHFLLDKEKSKNVLFVFASGNKIERDDRLSSPSSLATEYGNVISVTSINFDGDKPLNSLYGSGGNVSVAAPGAVYTTAPGNRYDWFDGTSAATPLVSGLAGLIWSAYPELPPQKVKEAIIEGSKIGGKMVPGENFYVINAYRSLEWLRQLPRPNHALSVHRTGLGEIISSPGGINCGNDCSGTYEEGTVVSLVITAAPGWTVTDLDCPECSIFEQQLIHMELTASMMSGTYDSSPEHKVKIGLPMDKPKSVFATFEQGGLLTVNKIGDGLVASMSGGIYCSLGCRSFEVERPIEILSATPAPGTTFMGWGGSCTGIDDCVLDLSLSRYVTASFTSSNYPLLKVNRIGAGTVTASSSGIVCGSNCSENFVDGEQITITATAGSGWVIDGWEWDFSFATFPDRNLTPIQICQMNLLANPGATQMSCPISMDYPSTITVTFKPR